MTEQEQRIAAAAMRVYARYGVKRATMTDVAKEAEVVRQTLYNVFPTKDALLRAAIRVYVEGQWARIRAGWDQTDDLGDKLDILFEHMALAIWQLVHSSPDARELEGGYNAAGRAEVALLEAEMLARFEAMLAPYAPGFARHGLTPARIAAHLKIAIPGIKYGADNLAEARDLAATQKAFILALAATG